MELSTVELITYLTLGLILYYFIMEVSKPKEGGQRWLQIGFLLVIVLIGLWFWWSYSKKKTPQEGETPEEDPKDAQDNDMSNGSQQDTYVQNGYVGLPKDFLATDPRPSGNKDGKLTYEEFKLWYLSPEFLTQFTEATKEALKIKRKRLLEVRAKYIADLKAIKGEVKPKQGMFTIISALDQNDDSKMIESTIAEIDMLLNEIKLKNVTVESSRIALTSAIMDRERGIESLSGRDDIKDFMALQLYTFARNPRIFLSNFQNIAIYGSSGVGKTKLAQVMGKVYSSSGILIRDHVYETTKQSFTTAYVNESARKTRKLLLSHLEGIVFIDEAYDMAPPTTIWGKTVDHGHEAITEMVNFLDKMKGLSIIIVAGYKDEMESRFMKANEGLPRRFPNVLELQPYQSKELTDICLIFLRKTCPELFNKNGFGPQQGNYLYTLIDWVNKNHPEAFEKQAGDMENLSGNLSRSIYGSPGLSWPKDYERILLSGINTFLSSKGMNIEPK